MPCTGLRLLCLSYRVRPLIPGAVLQVSNGHGVLHKKSSISGRDNEFTVKPHRYADTGICLLPAKLDFRTVDVNDRARGHFSYPGRYVEIHPEITGKCQVLPLLCIQLFNGAEIAVHLIATLIGDVLDPAIQCSLQLRGITDIASYGYVNQTVFLQIAAEALNSSLGLWPGRLCSLWANAQRLQSQSKAGLY